MKNEIKTICVFCASSESVSPHYKEIATDLGRQMGALGIDLVYGGASIGLMGCVARGVHERGGTVTGVLPEFMKTKEIEYSEADELIFPETMRERKAIMDEKSDAFIVLPGGIGTLEEAMEILALKSLKVTKKPLVFINIDNFFAGLIVHLNDMVRLNFAKPKILKLFEVKTDVQGTLDYILNRDMRES